MHLGFLVGRYKTSIQNKSLTNFGSIVIKYCHDNLLWNLLALWCNLHVLLISNTRAHKMLVVPKKSDFTRNFFVASGLFIESFVCWTSLVKLYLCFYLRIAAFLHWFFRTCLKLWILWRIRSRIIVSAIYEKETATKGSQDNFTYRYNDDIFSINNPDFENYLGQM